MKIVNSDHFRNDLLTDADQETIVHLTYQTMPRKPGCRNAASRGYPETIRPSSQEARREALRASDWDSTVRKRGSSYEEYVGHFLSLEQTRSGDTLLTLWVHNRGETGALRRFNVTKGKVTFMRVVK